MPRNPRKLPENRADWTFSDLVYWHVVKFGTHPTSHPDDIIGAPWDLEVLGVLVDRSERSIRNWMRNKNLPDDCYALSQAFFGDNPLWEFAKVELQDKLDEAWGRKGDLRKSRAGEAEGAESHPRLIASAPAAVNEETSSGVSEHPEKADLLTGQGAAPEERTELPSNPAKEPQLEETSADPLQPSEGAKEGAAHVGEPVTSPPEEPGPSGPEVTLDPEPEPLSPEPSPPEPSTPEPPEPEPSPPEPSSPEPSPPEPPTPEPSPPEPSPPDPERKKPRVPLWIVVVSLLMLTGGYIWEHLPSAPISKINPPPPPPPPPVKPKAELKPLPQPRPAGIDPPPEPILEKALACVLGDGEIRDRFAAELRQMLAGRIVVGDCTRTRNAAVVRVSGIASNPFKGDTACSTRDKHLYELTVTIDGSGKDASFMLPGTRCADRIASADRQMEIDARNDAVSQSARRVEQLLRDIGDP
jgi:hypothetical protein